MQTTMQVGQWIIIITVHKRDRCRRKSRVWKPSVSRQAEKTLASANLSGFISVRCYSWKVQALANAAYKILTSAHGSNLARRVYVSFFAFCSSVQIVPTRLNWTASGCRTLKFRAEWNIGAFAVSLCNDCHEETHERNVNYLHSTYLSGDYFDIRTSRAVWQTPCARTWQSTSAYRKTLQCSDHGSAVSQLQHAQEHAVSCRTASWCMLCRQLDSECENRTAAIGHAFTARAPERHSKVRMSHTRQNRGRSVCCILSPLAAGNAKQRCSHRRVWTAHCRESTFETMNPTTPRDSYDRGSARGARSVYTMQHLEMTCSMPRSARTRRHHASIASIVTERIADFHYHPLRHRSTVVRWLFEECKR